MALFLIGSLTYNTFGESSFYLYIYRKLYAQKDSDKYFTIGES